MRILLDTNFILTCVRQKIDFGSWADENFDEPIEWIVPQEVLNELGYLKDRKGMKIDDKKAAKLSFELLQTLSPTPKVVELGIKHYNVDIGIVNYILGTDIVLATLDRGLKERVDNKILTIRGKKNLEII